jgi:hypothetical protein
MRRFLARGVAVAAIGLAGSPSFAADPPPSVEKPSVEPRSWYARLNPFGEPPRQPGPRVRQAVAPLSEEALLSVLQAEKDAYTRRLDVCHRLREIAYETNDEKLEARVNELEKQVAVTYHMRMARLGMKSGGPLPALPTPSAEALNRTLGSGAVTPLTVGSKTTAGKTATAKAPVFKEVDP